MAENKPISESSENDVALRGGCRCGAITYTSTTLPSSLTNCHCLACRQSSGGPYITWASFPVSSLSWFSLSPSAPSSSSSAVIPGDSAISTYQANPWATRGHCGRCGSTIRLQYAFDAEGMSIAAGSIDEGSKAELPRPEMHIFLEEKADWDVLGADGLERHGRFSRDGGHDGKVEEWMREYASQPD